MGTGSGTLFADSKILRFGIIIGDMMDLASQEVEVETMRTRGRTLTLKSYSDRPASCLQLR